MGHVLHVTDENFAGEVLAAGVPVLVDVWASWCPPCRMLAPVLEQLAAENAGQVKVVKVDADHNPGVVNHLRVRSLPTLALFAGGREMSRHVGYAAKAELRQFIDAGLGAAR